MEREEEFFQVIVTVEGVGSRLVLVPHAADWEWVVAELSHRFGDKWPSEFVIEHEFTTVRRYACLLQCEGDWNDLKEVNKASNAADRTIHLTVRK